MCAIKVLVNKIKPSCQQTQQTELFQFQQLVEIEMEIYYSYSLNSRRYFSKGYMLSTME